MSSAKASFDLRNNMHKWNNVGVVMGIRSNNVTIDLKGFLIHDNGSTVTRNDTWQQILADYIIRECD